MNKSDRIYLASHTGLVGSSLLRILVSQGYTNILTTASQKVDLRNQEQTNQFFRQNKPEYVFLLASKVGSINYNTKVPAEFIYDNVMIQSNVIHAAKENGCKKLLLLGSATVYPKDVEQPIREDSIFTNKLDASNEAYALSKIFGMKMAKYYTQQYGMSTISLMAPNLYGPNDKFDPEKCHVIPGLINKFYSAKLENKEVVEAWGDGSPQREFLYVDDLTDACIFLMQNYDSPDHINVGSDIEISIRDLSEIIKNKIGYEGRIFWDNTKPNGTPRRKLDSTRLFDMGWKPKISFDEGLTKTIEWFIINKERFT